MAKATTAKKMSREQRKVRTYQVVFFIISAIVLITMIMSLVVKYP